MNALFHLRFRPWVMLILVIGLIAGHSILVYVLRRPAMSHAGVSGVVVVTGVVLLVVAKHLGLFAALLRSLHGLFRSRVRKRKI